MSLDYSPLGDAIRQLEKALAYARSDLALSDPYRQARNDSSHTYNQAKAEQVFALAPDFLAEAQAPYQALTRHAA